eukprot:2750084-Prymnesium_polylepis.1
MSLKSFFTRASLLSLLLCSQPAATTPPCAAPLETSRASAARLCARRWRVLGSPVGLLHLLLELVAVAR